MSDFPPAEKELEKAHFIFCRSFQNRRLGGMKLGSTGSHKRRFWKEVQTDEHLVVELPMSRVKRAVLVDVGNTTTQFYHDVEEWEVP